ncbi:DUF6441 family protein [Nitrospirillum bahiense]|uniref:Uncharacterized protein n=1 Tax=Nitrospirillum amazonense TaxID=28077 RepID=A0A560F1U3_9PROT|nr:DUF6441 family protein [Nitrospirillum amazonense]TWB15593.1 hypothetical protein FBZ88_12946 [Nitrospirillum amazonense]
MITATVDGTLSDAITPQVESLAARARTAVRDVATALQADLRGQVQAAGLGEGLTKAWRLNLYGMRRSDKPAGFVYSKATNLHAAFTQSGIVTARNAQWLAIPLPAALDRGFQLSPSRRGGKTGPLPAKWSNIDRAEDKFSDLTFIPLNGGARALLVANADSAGRRVRNGGRASQSIPLFLLVRKTRFRARLDFDGAVSRARDALGAAVVAAVEGE